MVGSHSALRASLRVGAVYDLAVGALILAAGERTLSALGFAAPADPFLFRLAALPLLILPVLYWTAARATEVETFRPAVLTARGGGGLLILILAVFYRPEAASVYAAIGAVDLVFAAVHTVLWRR